MPNRIIRESCRTSPTLAKLSDGAERFFWRLLTACDDYGRFNADMRIMLASCFPLLTDKVKIAHISRWLLEMEASGIVTLYTVGDKECGYFNKWSIHQRPPRLASKFPDPPTERSVPSEKTIHDGLFESLKMKKRFCGKVLLGVERNVRAGNGFADLVLHTEEGKIVVELKRTRADQGALKQIVGYRNHLQGVYATVIIATGIGPTAEISHFKEGDIALIVYSPNGKSELFINNKQIDECEPELLNVTSCEITTHRESRVESRESGDENRDTRDDTAHAVVSDTSGVKHAFEEFWEAYPKRRGKRIGKEKARVLFSTLSESDRESCLLAVKNYAASRGAGEGYCRDAERFIKADYWREWIEPETPQAVVPITRTKPLTPFQQMMERAKGAASQ